MERALLAAVLLAVLPGTFAQSRLPVQPEADPARLEAILAARNLPDLNRFVFAFINSGALPGAELEGVVARGLADPQFETPLVTMIGDARISYATLALNRALLGVLDRVIAWDPKQQPYRMAYIRKILLATVKANFPGSEQPLLDRIDRLPQEPGLFSQSNQAIVVEFLARRKYQPAVPYLSQRLLALPPDGGPHRGEPGALLSALARIDEPATVRAATQRLDRMAGLVYQPAMQEEMLSLFAYLHRNGVPFSNTRIAALLRDKPADDVFAIRLVETLARRPEKEAIDMVLARLEALARANPKSTRDLETALRAFESLRDQSLIDYPRLRRGLPPQMSRGAADAQLRLAERRGEPRAIADIPVSGLATLDVRTVERILESESPAQWREARERLDALQREKRIDPGVYRMLAAELDRALADPPAQIERGRRRMLARRFDEEKGAVTSLLIQTNKARGSVAWPERMTALISAAEQLEQRYTGDVLVGTLRNEIRGYYIELASHTRFVQKQPEKAVVLYDQSTKYDDSRAGRGFLADLLAGDTYQFDLRSSVQALRRYEAAAAKIAAAEKSEPNDYLKAMAGWWRGWLAQEVAFLRSGRRFSGQLTQREAGGFFLATMSLAGSGAPERSPADAGALEKLPPSRLSLATAVGLISTLPERDVLRHLDKHDPSGYWSACILGSVPVLDRALAQAAKEDRGDRAQRELAVMLPGVSASDSGFRRASTRFLAERKVVMKLE